MHSIRGNAALAGQRALRLGSELCGAEESGAGAARHFDVAGHRILGRVAADVRGALAIKLVRLRNLSLGRVAALALQS